LNHDRLNSCRYEKYGNAFGETVLSFQTPPNQSQMFSRPQSGFGGWADEKIKTPREAAPIIQLEKISSTTFDNISVDHLGNQYQVKQQYLSPKILKILPSGDVETIVDEPLYLSLFEPIPLVFLVVTALVLLSFIERSKKDSKKREHTKSKAT